MSITDASTHFMNKAVIFDMDGVIFDSERCTYECWKRLADREGLADFDSLYYSCIGTNADRTRELFLAAYGEDAPYETWRAEESALYHSLYDGGRLPKKPGILKLLTYLKGKCYYTAVASSTRTEVVTAQLHDGGLDIYFDKIIGGDMVTKSKPEPDIFLKAIEGTEYTPSDCFVIEDSYNGIRAAHAAGMKGIMVPDMLPPTEEMERLAVNIVPTLEEVMRIL